MTNTTQKLTPWQQACRLTGSDPTASITMEERGEIIFRASCKMLGQDPTWLPGCSAIDPEFRASAIAQYKLQVIIKAVNGPFKQDWNSWDQKKWSPWFALNAPGFRFDAAFCDYVSAYVTGGPRLCLRSKGRAEFVGRYCITLYRDLMGAGQLAPEALLIAA